MELQRPTPPPRESATPTAAAVAFSQHNHDPAELILPSVPRHDLSMAHGNVQLPCLRSVLSPDFDHDIRLAPLPDKGIVPLGSPMSVHSLPRIEPSNAFPAARHRPTDSAIHSPSEKDSMPASDERGRRPRSAISMDDPDVRIAAEALSGLGNMDFVMSPTRQTFHSSPMRVSIDEDSRSSQSMHEDPEPLLELFAQAHPWVGGTINGTINSSVYAYNTTKHYSPRFIQYGANLVERNIATPMVNTVGSVGRFTGVEDGLRRYLGARRPGEFEGGTDGMMDKRALALGEAFHPDVEMAGYVASGHTRRDSVDTLPAYRSSKPPSYREEYSPAVTDRHRQLSRPAHPRSWSSQVAGQVFVMTSGLGVALSVTSRRSLQFCLSLLSQATEHVATVTNALKMVLDQYDQARISWHHRQQQPDASMEKGQRPHTPEHDEAARRLAQLIKHHCDDIWQTLKTVVTTVSNSAGGALPDNARHFVRTQLMSLPQRWRLVSEQHSGDSETSRGAHRMIAFATEGLDMMNQVSQVCKATLDSAERWLERVGRREVERPMHHEKDHDMMDAEMTHPA